MVETSERRDVRTESPLFYILPPLLVAAVFVYCMVGTPDVQPAAASATPVAADGEQTVAEEDFDMDDFSDEELDVDSEPADATGN